MALKIPSRIESEGHFFPLSDLELEETGMGGSFTVSGFMAQDLHRDWELLSGEGPRKQRIFITSASQLPKYPRRSGEAPAPARVSCQFLWYIQRARLV